MTPTSILLKVGVGQQKLNCFNISKMDDIVRLEKAFVGFCFLAGIAIVVCCLISKTSQPTENLSVPCKACADKIQRLEKERLS